MKYLSSISRVPPQITNDGKSVKDSNREGLEDKLPFDIWKEKQQKRRHGYCLIVRFCLTYCDDIDFVT